jgi:large subunit ribosomal protein L25
MAKTVVVYAKVRNEFGKNPNRRLRANGLIPGVVYGRSMDAVAVTVDPRDIHRILHSDSGRNTIFKLDVEGASKDVLIRDFQLDPIRDTLVHADFQAIAMDQAMVFEVPVEPVGMAAAVKAAGGLLDVVLRTIEVECLPADVPDHIRIDVSNMNVGDSLRISQVQVDTSKLRILNDPDLTVINVSLPAIEKVEEAPAPEAEEEVATAEPEVIKKGKAEEEASEE